MITLDKAIQHINHPDRQSRDYYRAFLTKERAEYAGMLLIFDSSAVNREYVDMYQADIDRIDAAFLGAQS